MIIVLLIFWFSTISTKNILKNSRVEQLMTLSRLQRLLPFTSLSLTHERNPIIKLVQIG